MRNVPSWDEYFLTFAKTAAIRSKDPSTQVGAVIVNDRKHIVSTGYNGFAAGCPDTPQLWDVREEKYKRVIHAETNAIGAAADQGTSTRNCTIYVTHSPCEECAKVIVAAGIQRVVTYPESITGGMRIYQERGLAFLQWASIEVAYLCPAENL
jgi:dCMP deaminase